MFFLPCIHGFFIFLIKIQGKKKQQMENNTSTETKMQDKDETSNKDEMTNKDEMSDEDETSNEDEMYFPIWEKFYLKAKYSSGIEAYVTMDYDKQFVTQKPEQFFQFAKNMRNNNIRLFAFDDSEHYVVANALTAIGCKEITIGGRNIENVNDVYNDADTNWLDNGINTVIEKEGQQRQLQLFVARPFEIDSGTVEFYFIPYSFMGMQIPVFAVLPDVVPIVK